MKKMMTLEQLNAIRILYDKPLTKKTVFRYALFPSVYLPLMFGLILYRWWLVPVGFCLGLLYGYGVVVPKRVQAQYQRRSLMERNRFINHLTQSLHRRHTTILDALQDVAQNRLEGELQRDIQQLSFAVATQSVSKRKVAYDKLMLKYESDRLFVQFIEHVITVDQNGKGYLEPLDETAKAHDQAVEWQELMMDRKKEALLYFLTNNVLAFILCSAVIVLTWENHKTWFTRSFLGVVIGVAYLVLTFFYNHKFLCDYNDHEIMVVKL